MLQRRRTRGKRVAVVRLVSKSAFDAERLRSVLAAGPALLVLPVEGVVMNLEPRGAVAVRERGKAPHLREDAAFPWP